jgi:hypothetical protein
MTDPRHRLMQSIANRNGAVPNAGQELREALIASQVRARGHGSGYVRVPRATRRAAPSLI